MSHVVLQPSASASSLKHFKDTVQSPVSLDDVVPLLDAPDLAALRRAHPNGLAQMWGAKTGERLQQIPKWQRMVAGDYIMFAGQGRLFASAVVTHTFRNRPLAEHLWGSSPTANGVDQTWELMFSISDIRAVDVTYPVLNDLIGRKPAAAVQEFSVLDEDKSEILLEYLNLTDNAYFEQPAIETYESVVLSDDFGALEEQVLRGQRLEQRFLRKAILPGTHGTCGLCGRDFAVQFLTAAHIKRRAVCTDEEKRRFTDVAMINCRFGCDELFGQGFVAVDGSGHLVISDLLLDTTARKYADANLVGRRCEVWSRYPGTREFFSFHQSNDFKVAYV